MPELKRSLPLHTRLALGYGAFFALVLTLLGVGVYLAVQTALMNQMRHELQTSSDLIQQDFDASNDALRDYFNEPNFLIRTHPRIEGLDSPALYVQAATANGMVVVTSPSLQNQLLPLDASARATAMAGQTRIDQAQLGASSVLILTRPLLADQNIVGVLQVAQPLREINQTLRLLLFSLAASGVIALLASLRGGAWLAARALRPVAEVAQTARQIVRAEDLAQRVRPAASDDEIGALVSTVNEMLERLETLFNSQRRFVADVSHELRTPLTAMRGNLEILRRGAARDPQQLGPVWQLVNSFSELQRSLAAMEREVNRLVRLASDLLLLAQAETGAILRHEPVALDELVLEVVRELAPLSHGITLAPDVAEQVEALGDRDRIKQALLNMVVNALQHTPAGGKVCVALERMGQRARLSVSDTGAGISEGDLMRVFDRFYRADKARSRVTGGAGLGLAIVKWVADAHGGTVEACSTPGQGSLFILWLPIEQKV